MEMGKWMHPFLEGLENGCIHSMTRTRSVGTDV